MGTEMSVSQMGLDVHKKFSRVTARDSNGKVAWRQRLEHSDRMRMRQQLQRWPQGTPVILEGTFGWGWLSGPGAIVRADFTPQLRNLG